MYVREYRECGDDALRAVTCPNDRDVRRWRVTCPSGVSGKNVEPGAWYVEREKSGLSKKPKRRTRVEETGSKNERTREKQTPGQKDYRLRSRALLHKQYGDAGEIDDFACDRSHDEFLDSALAAGTHYDHVAVKFLGETCDGFRRFADSRMRIE